MQLPCPTTKAYTKSFGGTDAGYLPYGGGGGGSSVVESDAQDAALTRGKAIVKSAKKDMNTWLKELRCAAGCDIALIHIGPPTIGTPVVRAVLGVGRHRTDVIGYSWSIAVTASLTVDCHTPVANGTPHEPGTGLPDYDESRDG